MMEGNFVKRLLYLVILGLMTTMVFAPAALAQDYTSPTTTAPTATTTPTQYTPTTATEAIDEETPSTTTTTPLPDTGGPSLLIPAVGLLLASGLIGLGVMRRK